MHVSYLEDPVYGEGYYWCMYDLELVVETFDFEALWCNLTNSMIHELELGGLYVIMKEWSLVNDFGKVVVLTDTFRSEDLNNFTNDA